MLCEDDDNLRALAREILESQGYTVLEGLDPEDTLRIAAQHGGTIHLLLTDVVMPHMNGRALADAVKGVRPQISMLYMSGYADDAIVRHGVFDSTMAFLQKPFTPTELARRVREVLDQAQ